MAIDAVDVDDAVDAAGMKKANLREGGVFFVSFRMTGKGSGRGGFGENGSTP